MSSLLNITEKFIKRNGLFSKEDKLLVAVSGGVDSMVVAQLLFELGYSLEIAHCNFGLRGSESDEDELLVKKWAVSLDIPFHTNKFETAEFAADQRLSIQMAARELRYKWFDKIIATRQLDYLVTAHHSEDQTETILFNWTKGTGIKGLRGILPKSNRIVRPVLFALKKDIIQFAKENRITWREDVSNQSTQYHRNKLRHTVIPQLKEINPGLHATVTNDTIRHRALEELLDDRTETIKKQFLSSTLTGHELNLEWATATKGGLVILENLLSDFGLNLSQCQSILNGLDQSGLQFQSEHYQFILDRKRLLIEHGQAESFQLLVYDSDEEVEIGNQKFSFSVHDGSVAFSNDHNMAFLDADKVLFPLKGRNWDQGDRFTPLGMKGQKKVSDFMIDAKIPVNLKRRTVIFESRGEIVWIAGYRISDKHKITSSTKRSLIIKMHSHA